MLDESRLQEEVERRILLLKDNDEALMRYDLNGNGVIDDWEWEEIRRVINVQVQTQWRRNVLDWQSPASKDNADEAPARWAPSTQMLEDRYDITRELGQGAQGYAFIGRDIETGRTVVIKKLLRAHIGDAQLERFFTEEWPRLAALEHRGIAPYIDAFEHEEYFVLVQEKVEGVSLDEMLRGDAHFSEEDVLILVMELLDVLVDLHDQRPPILHHDIKPSNILQHPDGHFVLVDFGALPAAREGYVVGTSGYTPVEELMGQPTPASDLYGLGATAIHLLSRIHPGDMPIEFMQIRFRPFINVSEPFADFLARLVEAHADHRFPSAREALIALDGCLDGLHDTRRQLTIILQARTSQARTSQARTSQAEQPATTVLTSTAPTRVDQPAEYAVEQRNDQELVVQDMGLEDQGPSLSMLLITTILAFALGYFLAVQPF